MKEQRSADPVSIETYRAAMERIDRLENVLRGAVEVIKTWHNMDGSHSVWPIYWRNAPEMRPIREALE